MARMVATDENAIFDDHDEALAHIWKYIYQFANSMALKCAVELRIADIIQSVGGNPIKLSQIACAINSPFLDISKLERVMRMLVRMKIFTSTTDPSNGGDTLYGMTPCAKFLLHNAEVSLGPLIVMETHPTFQAAWHYLSRCVKEGGDGFTKAHGRKSHEIFATNLELNKLLNDAMQCVSRIFMPAVISKYSDGFNSINGSLVDVGGGTGQSLAEIVKAFPHIKGINFDLPHVVATAPEINGVTHAPDDVFEAIPAADAVFIKHVLHNWGDEDCVKILKNCRRAITGKGGKIIIVDSILKADADELYENSDVVLDLLMMAVLDGAKERTELQWKKLLEKAGLPRYNIIELPHFNSIIEAYLE